MPVPAHATSRTDCPFAEILQGQPPLLKSSRKTACVRGITGFAPLHFQARKAVCKVVMDRSAQEYKRETAAKKRTAEKHRRRIAEFGTLIERLYVDNVSGENHGRAVRKNVREV